MQSFAMLAVKLRILSHKDFDAVVHQRSCRLYNTCMSINSSHYVHLTRSLGKSVMSANPEQWLWFKVPLL